MDWVREKRVGENLRTFVPCWRRARFIGSQYGSAVGDASGEMERYADADEVWGEGVDRSWSDGSRCEGSRSRIMTCRMGESHATNARTGVLADPLAEQESVATRRQRTAVREAEAPLVVTVASADGRPGTRRMSGCT